MLQWRWERVHLFEILILIVLDIHLKVGLTDDVDILFLIVWGTITLYSIVVVRFYIATNSTPGLWFFHIFPNISHLLLFCIKVILSRGRWCLIAFLFLFFSCISLMISDNEHLLIYLISICVSSLEKCLFKFFANY
jgi:hypothetical protein